MGSQQAAFNTPPKLLDGISPILKLNRNDLSKSFKDCNSMQNSGCHDKQKEKLKKSSCQKLLAQGTNDPGDTLYKNLLTLF